MSAHNLKRKLGWLECALYVGGAILLVVFFQIRGESDRLSQEGLEAFHQANTGVESPQPEIEMHGEQAPGDRAGDWQPDQTLWSESRKEEFRQARLRSGEQPLAVLTIDHLGITVPVYNGTDEFNLNRGVGRIKGTSWIDSEGNLGIAGHRDSFFRPLKDIEIGDSIDVQTARGTITYEVSSIEITDPSDVSVLTATQEKTLTLVTCYPFYYVGHAPQRYIVKATAKHFLAKT